MTDILTAEDLASIDQALEMIRMLRTELKRAQQAGIDPGFTDADLTAREQQLLKLKRTYFPNAPAKQSTA